MSTITINIPSELLALDFWKTHWYYIYIPIHVLYAWIHHFAALPKIRRWNNMSDGERKAAAENRSDQICLPHIVAMFLLTTAFYFPVRAAYFGLRMALCPLVFISTGKITSIPSWNEAFKVSHGLLPDRFA